MVATKISYITSNLTSDAPFCFPQSIHITLISTHSVRGGGGYNKDAVVFVCAIKADGPLDSHKFSSGSLKGWHQIDLVEAKKSVDKLLKF